jgi:hypothetical protein
MQYRNLGRRGIKVSPYALGALMLATQVDEIVPPGTDIGTLDQAYVPPAIQKTELRRRPLGERSAA